MNITGRKLLKFAFLCSALTGCGGMTTTSTATTQATATRPAAATTIEGSAASCAGLTPSRQFAAARVVFVGRFHAGPSIRLDSRSVLISPARVRVARYFKGRGPAVARVDTAISATGAVSEDGIEPQTGETRRIFATSPHGPYSTSMCIGSERIPPHHPDRLGLPTAR